MHQRVPGTVKDAITIIKTQLGAELMAQAVSKTTSLMQKWSNPDEPALPNISQALALATVSNKVMNDGKFFDRLAAGKGCTVDSYQRVMNWFDENEPKAEALP